MKISLINGNFKKEDAWKTIQQLFDVKINFHESKISHDLNEEDIQMRESKIRRLNDDLLKARDYINQQENDVAIISEIAFPDSSHQLELINSKFKPEDAHQLLVSFINSKINYHSIEAFRIKELNNGDSSHSTQRIAALKKVKEKLVSIIEQAVVEGKELYIESSLDVRLINPS